MAITLVQSAQGSDGSGSASVTWGGSTTSGNLLVACVSCSRAQSAGSPPTITAPDGSWVQAVTQIADNAAGVRVRTSIYYKANASGESGAKTWTCTTYMSAASIGVVVAEYSGIATASPLDQTASTADNSGTSTSCTTGTTGTTAQADELLVACVNGGSSLESPTNSFTIQNQTTSARFTALADRIVSSTGTYSTTATYSTGSRNVGTIATFQAAAAASETYEEACQQDAPRTKRRIIPIGV